MNDQGFSAANARPERFYKFLGLGTKTHVCRFRDTLLRCHLWMSSRPHFNDPFDCRPFIDMAASDEEKTQWLREYLRGKFPGATDHWLDDEATRRVHHPDTDTVETLQEARRRIQEGTDKIGVLSLTATCEPILLWSHYTDGHRGVCLEFRSVEEKDLFAAARKVEYLDKYPVIKAYSDKDPERFAIAVLTKSKAWSYEQEWRVINVHKADCHIEFFPENLVGVILGSQMSKRCAGVVRRWASQSPARPRLLQARLQEKVYGLHLDPIDD